MKYQIAVQLYTLRQEMKRDFKGTLRRLVEIGFETVETAGLPENISNDEIAKILKDMGLRVCSAHLPLPLGENKSWVIDMAGALGCHRILALGLNAEDFAGKDRIRATCDLLNEANVVARENELALGIHNHWWEFQPVGGVYPYELCLEYLEPDVFFELDVYWIQSTGLNPAKIVSLFGDRAPLLHIKDGPAGPDTEAPMTALGQGKVDIGSILKASEGQAEWLIVELDRCDCDMMQAVEQSYDFLKELV